jgi:hypothetical protein
MEKSVLVATVSRRYSANGNRDHGTGRNSSNSKGQIEKMRNQWITATFAAALAMLGTAQSSGADLETVEWAALRAAVIGRNVEISADGQPAVRGKVTEVTEDEIQVRNKKQAVSIPRAEVEQVADKQKAKRARNALLAGAIGAGVMAAVGLGVVAGLGGSDDVAGVVALPIALGGAAGAGIGAAAPGGYRAVYRQ